MKQGQPDALSITLSMLLATDGGSELPNKSSEGSEAVKVYLFNVMFQIWYLNSRSEMDWDNVHKARLLRFQRVSFCKISTNTPSLSYAVSPPVPGTWLVKFEVSRSFFLKVSFFREFML